MIYDVQECRSSWVPDSKSLQYFLSYCIILCSVLLVWKQPPHPINNAVCLGLKTLFGGRCWQIVWAFKKNAYISPGFLSVEKHTSFLMQRGVSKRDCIVANANKANQQGSRGGGGGRHPTPFFCCLCLFDCFLFICLRNPMVYSFKSVVMMHVPVAL